MANKYFPQTKPPRFSKPMFSDMRFRPSQSFAGEMTLSEHFFARCDAQANRKHVSGFCSCLACVLMRTMRMYQKERWKGTSYFHGACCPSAFPSYSG